MNTKKRTQRTTEMSRGERMVTIFRYLIEKHSNPVTVRDVWVMINQIEPVSRRNVERDLKDLADMRESVVESDVIQKKLKYFILPDVRDQLTLPIQNNGLLVLFLLKRLQPYLAPQSRSAEEIYAALSGLIDNEECDLFEDLDERLTESTFFIGEKPLLSLDGRMLNTLVTSLVKQIKLSVKYRRDMTDVLEERVILPVKLVLHKQELYFVCMSEKGESINYYMKICRIADAQLTNATFTVSEARKQKVEQWLNKSFGILDNADANAENIELKFTNDLELVLSERSFHKTQKLMHDHNGNLIMTMHVPINVDLVRWIMWWGDMAEVIYPEKLRMEIRGLGIKLAEKYGNIVGKLSVALKNT